MTTAPFTVVGFQLGDFTPGYYAQLQYGVGAIALGTLAVKQLNIGNKLAAGSMTPNVDLFPIYSGDDSDTKVGAASELAQMNEAALQVQGISLYNIAVTEATGANATVTVVFSGTWTTAGYVYFRLNGKTYTVNFAVTDITASLAGAAAEAAFNADPHCPATATNTTGSVAIVVDQVGVRGNEYLLAIDATNKPSGMVITTTGGSVIHGTTTSTISLIPFAGGSGADAITTALTVVANDVYDFIALAQHDATNVGLMKTFIAAEAGSTIGHLEQVIVGFNSARATNISFAQATLNDPNFSSLCMLNGETYPAAIAANASAARAAINPALPNYNWDGYVLTAVYPHQWDADKPLKAHIRASLSGGCTELNTVNGKAVITSGIQSHCKNGAAADYRILYWGEDYVPKVFAKTVAAKWAELCMPKSDGSAADNPYVGTDLPPDQIEQQQGTMRPLRWYGEVLAIENKFAADNMLQDVSTHLPVVVYDSGQAAIMCAAPIVVKAQNHRGALLVRQTSRAA